MYDLQTKKKAVNHGKDCGFFQNLASRDWIPRGVSLRWLRGELERRGGNTAGLGFIGDAPQGWQRGILCYEVHVFLKLCSSFRVIFLIFGSCPLPILRCCFPFFNLASFFYMSTVAIFPTCLFAEWMHGGPKSLVLMSSASFITWHFTIWSSKRIIRHGVIAAMTRRQNITANII